MAAEARDGTMAAPAHQGGPTGPVIRVFGGIGVDDGTDPVSIGGPKQRRLLALLAVRSGSVVSIDWLAEYLWDDDERPEATAPAIRTYMSRLRQALPIPAREWIETEPSGYRLSAPAESVEHLQFSMLRAEATRARDRDDPLVAHRLLDLALQLWRGEPFRDLEDLEVARSDIERLHLERLEMLEERWEAALALGRHTQITGELAAFTAEHGERDRAVRQHALALYRSGRTADGLRAISDHRRRLADASGLDPSSAMVELERAMFDGDPSLDVEKVGRPLRGYRLLEEAGVGAFSVVWRGMQPSVNREVAIKQIRSELATQPQFIRRFEAEAHLVARLEHPHIVPLIDFWRDPDSAYLVMRWLAGGTLERRLDEGPLSVAETLTLARQVGGALSAAHRQGIVHRDVKTANILFDGEGNAFLGDFGIALATTESSGPEAALSPGSPVYASPEQIRGELLGPQADVFSLGVVIFECLTGTLPFPATSSAEEMIDRQLNLTYPTLAELRIDIPHAISEAVATATAKRPEDRFESVSDFIEALQTDAEWAEPAPALDVDVASEDGEVDNPYLGLRAFDGGDSTRFFGRERLVHELLDQLRGGSIASRCVVVVGPSGSGKSSVVRAGLVPALRNGDVEGSADWFTTTMVPGNDPYESLEAALLRVAVNPPQSLLGQLRDGRRGILRGVRRCLGDERNHLAIVVDQFEEVFTGQSAADAHDFLDALAVAVEDPTSPLRLIVTLRADYYHRPLEHPTFAPVLRSGSIDVLPLAADELERAIVEPARSVGVSFEPGLVARIAAETVGQPSPLPLLQYTLSELFERRTRDGRSTPGVVTIAAYDELGGLAGALSARAESIYDDANLSQREAIRTIFGRMTNPGEDTTDLRRRVAIADLGDADETGWVLERFGAARLVTFDRDDATREPTIEVAHEALLRQWPRLVGWLDEDRDVLRSASLIAAAATTWDRGGREGVDLYRGGRLDGAVDLALTAQDRLRPLDLHFITASQSAAETDRGIEARRIRRLRRLVMGVAAALVVALIAGGVAVRQQQRADDEANAALTAADEAEVATLISRSAASSSDEPGVSILLALEAHRRAPGSETEQAVLSALASSANVNLIATFPFLDTESTDCPTGFIDRDGLNEFGVVGGRLLRQDLVTGEVIDHGPAAEPCGQWLGDLATDRGVLVCCDGARTWVGPFDEPGGTALAYTKPRTLVSRRLAGDRLVFTQTDPVQVLLADAVTGEFVGRAIGGPSTRDVLDVEISIDGGLVAVSFLEVDRNVGTGRIVVIDTETAEVVQDVSNQVFPVAEVFAPALTIDSATNEVIAALDDGSLITVDIDTGDVVESVETSATSKFLDIGVRSDGVVTVVSEGQIELVDRALGSTGVIVSVNNASGARIRADDSVVVLTSDRRSEVYAFGRNALVERFWDIDPLGRVTFDAGQASVTRSPSQSVELVDLTTGDRTVTDLIDSEGEEHVALYASPEPDGFWAVVRTGLERWSGGEMVEKIDLAELGVTGTRFEERFANVTIARNGDTSVQLLDLTPGSGRVLLRVSAPNASSAHPALGGGMHVIDVDGTVRTYDADGGLIAELDTGAENVLINTVDPTTGRLALADGSGGVVLADTTTGDVERLPNRDSLSNLGWARGGELLVMTALDGAVRLWDAERGVSAGLLFQGTGAGDASPSFYDETTDSVWVASSGQLLQFPLDPARWVERACEAVGRDFTQEEWQRLVPGDEPLQVACA